jgi:G:T-mismatch repair DNA endonuclease (very short patch repair protein)
MTRQKWWKEKLDKNVMRDREAVKTLHEIGWRVFVVWECALKVQKHVPETLISLSKNIPKRETDLLQYTGTDKLTCRQNPISFG